MKKTKNLHIIIALLLLLSISVFIGFIKRGNLLGNLHNKEDIADAKKVTDESNDKIVYLTFDDGPSRPVTERLLDTLNECNVKATFFVVGKEIPGCESLLKRIRSEGHGIGVHTYSHSYKKIYKSRDVFINENIAAADLVYDITGFRPKVLRFPRGSHNRLNEEFLHQINQSGFKVFDWTNSCEDGVSPNSQPDKLYKNSLKKIISKKKSPGLIILMHSNCNNENTVKALPKIVNHFRNLGYEFHIIDENTPEYYSE